MSRVPQHLLLQREENDYQPVSNGDFAGAYPAAAIAAAAIDGVASSPMPHLNNGHFPFRFFVLLYHSGRPKDADDDRDMQLPFPAQDVVIISSGTTREVVTVPKEAVVCWEDEQYIFVQTSPGKFEKTPVPTGRQENEELKK